METKFTKGEWKVISEFNSGRKLPQVVVMDRNVGVVLADILYGPEYTIEEGTANAHLIAAAPELYQALELIVASHDDMIHQGGEGFLTYNQIREARLALKKVRGE